MTKIAERVMTDDGKLMVLQTHDFTPTLNMAQSLRSAEAGHLGESRCVGLLPMKLWAEWAKEAGISPGDTHAMKEVVRRKMNDGSFSKLRIWEGRY